MSKKYVIEIEEEPHIVEDGVEYFRCTQAPWWSTSRLLLNRLTPYEKDRLDALTDGVNQGYEKGYQKGLEDAWETAKKLVWETCVSDLTEMGFFEEHETDYASKVLEKYTAQEAIEKLKKYEEQKDKLKVGDEIEWYPYGDINTRAVILTVNDLGFTEVCSDGSVIGHRYTDGDSPYRKTGRHFYTGVKALVRAMREESE